MNIKGLLSTSTTDTLDIRGVSVKISGSNKGVSRREWKSVLRDWLNEFDRANWLSDFKSIHIGEDIVSGDAIGRYTLDNSIKLEREPRWGTDMLVESSPRSMLIHEMIHYVHIELCHGEKQSLSSDECITLSNEVGVYACINSFEAVAEIGTGIVLGYEYPDEVHEIYERYNGPQEVYDIGTKIR